MRSLIPLALVWCACGQDPAAAALQPGLGQVRVIDGVASTEPTSRETRAVAAEPGVTLDHRPVPEGGMGLSQVRSVRFSTVSPVDGELTVEISSPLGFVFHRFTTTVRAGEPAVTDLLVAGTQIEQRQMSGVWTAVAFVGDQRVTADFELTP